MTIRNLSALTQRIVCEIEDLYSDMVQDFSLSHEIEECFLLYDATARKTLVRFTVRKGRQSCTRSIWVDEPDLMRACNTLCIWAATAGFEPHGWIKDRFHPSAMTTRLRYVGDANQKPSYFEIEELL